MTLCANCGKNTLHQEDHGWYCFGCGSVGLGTQPTDLKERPCSKCGISSFKDPCYICCRKDNHE